MHRIPSRPGAGLAAAALAVSLLAATPGRAAGAAAGGMPGAGGRPAGVAPYDPAYRGQRSGVPFTVRSAQVTVLDGPNHDHPVTLDTDLYVPASATAASPAPLLLQTHGFGLSKTAPEVTATAAFFARHGYVVQTWSAQGFGHSGGCITLDASDYDVQDARALLDRDQQLPYVLRDATGVVAGIYGGSYGGGLDATLAENDPRIRAIAPGRSWNSLQYALDPNNLIAPGDPTGFNHQLATQGVFKAQWTSLFYALGNAQPVGGIPPTGSENGGCPQDKAAAVQARPGDPAALADLAGAAGCPGYHLPLCQVYGRVSSTGDLDDAARALLAGASAQTRIDRLRVPTLLVQGESDTLFNENDAAATYLALAARGVPVEWIWNSGGHGGYDSLPGECEVYGGGTANLDGCYLTSRTLAWFDKWLGGARIDTGPGFSYYRDWTPPAAGTPNASTSYGDAPLYPAAADTRFDLFGTSGLVPPHAADNPSTVPIEVPGGTAGQSYSETSNFSGPQSSPNLAGPPSDPGGQYAEFTTAPFAADTVSAGIGRAHLRITDASGRDMIFFVKMYDVAPDGSATLLHRLAAPVRVPSADLGAPVDLHLLGLAHLFRAGHALRIRIAATDMAYRNSATPDMLTLTTGGTDRSWISVPLLGAGRLSPAAAAAPAAGAPALTVAGASATGALATTGLPTVLPVGALLLCAAAAGLRRRARRPLPRGR